MLAFSVPPECSTTCRAALSTTGKDAAVRRGVRGHQQSFTCGQECMPVSIVVCATRTHPVVAQYMFRVSLMLITMSLPIGFALLGNGEQTFVRLNDFFFG